MRILLLSIVLIFVGCGPNIVFEQTYDVGEEWSYDEVMNFVMEAQDTTQQYDLQFVLDHSVDFTYQNLYVLISTTYPDGVTVEDIVSLQLANKLGEFNGSCSGESCKLIVILQEGFRFKQLGTHTITIAQHSRREILEGISSGQLRLVEYVQDN